MTEFICIGDRLINIEHIATIVAYRLSMIGENDEYRKFPALYPGYGLYPNLTRFVLDRLSDKEKQDIGWYMAHDDKFVATNTWEEAERAVASAKPGTRRLNSGRGKVTGYFEVGTGPFRMQHTKWIDGQPVQDCRWHLPLGKYRQIIAYKIDLNCPSGGMNYDHESYFVMARDFQGPLKILKKYMSADWPEEA